jgi:hypothetical protein
MGQRATIPATRVVTVAVTNKLARIVWAIMERGSTFRERPFGIARRKLAWQDVRLQAPLCRTNSEVGQRGRNGIRPTNRGSEHPETLHGPRVRQR